MKNFLTALVFVLGSTAHAQSIVGQWQTFDDKTKELKSVVEIYEEDGRFFARIVKSFVSEVDAVCETCKGELKGEPIIGLGIIENLRKQGDEYSGGSIMDPENGKTYKCTLGLIDSNRLKVRGYIGIALLGRTQYWTRKEHPDF